MFSNLGLDGGVLSSEFANLGIPSYVFVGLGLPSSLFVCMGLGEGLLFKLSLVRTQHGQGDGSKSSLVVSRASLCLELCFGVACAPSLCS